MTLTELITTLSAIRDSDPEIGDCTVYASTTLGTHVLSVTHVREYDGVEVYMYGRLQ